MSDLLDGWRKLVDGLPASLTPGETRALYAAAEVPLPRLDTIHSPGAGLATPRSDQFQKVLVKLLRQARVPGVLPSFDTEGQVIAHLKKSIQNTRIDEIREAQRATRLAEGLAREPAPPVPAWSQLDPNLVLADLRTLITAASPREDGRETRLRILDQLWALRLGRLDWAELLADVPAGDRYRRKNTIQVAHKRLREFLMEALQHPTPGLRYPPNELREVVAALVGTHKPSERREPERPLDMRIQIPEESGPTEGGDHG